MFCFHVLQIRLVFHRHLHRRTVSPGDEFGSVVIAITCSSVDLFGTVICSSVLMIRWSLGDTLSSWSCACMCSVLSIIRSSTLCEWQQTHKTAQQPPRNPLCLSSASVWGSMSIDIIDNFFMCMAPSYVSVAQTFRVCPQSSGDLICAM